MAGLLDWMGTPSGIGLLSAVAGGMAGARRGTPFNNVGRGAVAGLTGYSAAQDQIRQDEENALTKQYKSLQMQELERKMADAKAQQAWKAGLPGMMAPKLTGSTDQGRQLAEQNAAFGQEGLPALAESAQYAQPDAPLNMNYGVDKQAAQDYLMRPESPYADEMIKRQFLPNNEGRTAEQKNWEYAQSLTPEQREMFMARSGGGAAPATVQEWEYFNKLDPQSQGRFLEMKRNPQIMNLGGEQAVRAPGGGKQEVYPVTPKPTDMPAFQAAQETAKATAKAGVANTTAEAAKTVKANNVLDLITQAESVIDNASGSKLGALWSSGKRSVGVSDDTTRANQQLKLISGWMVSNVPRMEGPQSNFDVQNYREMAGMVGDESIPIKDRKAALKQLRVLQGRYAGAKTNGKTVTRTGTVNGKKVVEYSDGSVDYAQ